LKEKPALSSGKGNPEKRNFNFKEEGVGARTVSSIPIRRRDGKNPRMGPFNKRRGVKKKKGQNQRGGEKSIPIPSKGRRESLEKKKENIQLFRGGRGVSPEL